MTTLQDTSQIDYKLENQLLRNEIKLLKEQIDWFRRNLFGKSSERQVAKTSHNVLYFEGMSPEELQKPEPLLETVPEHKRRKANRNGNSTITLPSDLPVERKIFDIPEEDKICKDTGKPLIKIGEEVCRRLACTAVKYFIKEIVRPKYALPAETDGGILTAELPESLLDRCMADESFLADILVKKFADHLPLYRQAEMLLREKIHIPRQSLSNWVNRAGIALKPLYDEMTAQVLKSDNVFIDESPVALLAPGKGKVDQAYMWVLVGGQCKNPSYRIYNFRTNRNHDNAQELLKGYTGVLHSDKFGGYEKLANAKQIKWCPCWAHIRRKFFEVESGDTVFRDWVLRKIRYLYMFERIAWSRSEEERLRIRVDKEVPIIDELIHAIRAKLYENKALKKSKLYQAVRYFCGLIPYLKTYTQYANAHLDNNVAERAVRPIAIGRKNWLFVGSEIGGEATAILLSLIQSCRELKINPREYLEDVMRRLMSHNSQKLHELLPDQWSFQKQQNA